jgi:hypothetical protein
MMLKSESIAFQKRTSKELPEKKNKFIIKMKMKKREKLKSYLAVKTDKSSENKKINSQLSMLILLLFNSLMIVVV